MMDALARAQRVITSYSARCEQCEFMSLVPRDSRVHCLAAHHRISEVRKYTLIPIPVADEK